jgi:hypothetical protein
MIITNELLVKSARNLVSATFQDDMKRMISVMLSHNVSMIPIVRGGKENLALIRRKRIWKYMIENQQKLPEIDEMKEKPLPDVKLGDPLEDTLDKISSNSAVLLADEDGVFRKILTPKSVAESLYEYSTKYVKINNLENRLKDLINGLSKASVKKCLTTEYQKYSNGVGVEKRVPDLDKLTMMDYQLILNNLWDSFSTIQHLDKKTMNRLLEDSRNYRNDVMHFRLTDEVTEETNPCEQLLKMLPNNIMNKCSS